MKSKLMGAKVSAVRRTKRYAGCHVQRNAHGCGRFSLDIFAEDTPENRAKWPQAERNAQGSLWVGCDDWQE